MIFEGIYCDSLLGKDNPIKKCREKVIASIWEIKMKDIIYLLLIVFCLFLFLKKVIMLNPYNDG